MSEESQPLIAQARALTIRAQGVLPDAGPELERILARIDEPLRVAIAGKVKAGKSTLLNALVGEKLAPTDTGECTKVVTWYRDGHTYEVMVHPSGPGPAKQVPFRRDGGAVDIDLGGMLADDIARIDVSWPSSSLRKMTLIDTPGVDSVNAEIGARSVKFLDSSEESTEADAVLYLMKHMHTSDLHLLEAFHDDEVSSPNPVNAIAILSRADEIGVGRLDSMASARRIASRYEDDPKLRRLVQIVMPVAGLLAETAKTLTQLEFSQLRELSAVPPKEIEVHLLSADRFIEARADTPLTSLDRANLLDRFGLFGIRLALPLLRREVVTTSSELSDELVQRSGLVDLQQILATLFVDRADVLKARSGLLAVERLCLRDRNRPGVDQLLVEVERIVASAHPFKELSSLAALRGGAVKGKKPDLLRLERDLGATGTTPWQRLGLAATADENELRTATYSEIASLQRLAESPFSNHDLAAACRVAIRSMEALLVAEPAP
ncbi:MAG: dynamin family protein [Acidimicrobiales bacterium]